MILICIDWEKVSFICGGVYITNLTASLSEWGGVKYKEGTCLICKKCIIHTMISVDSCKEQ